MGCCGGDREKNVAVRTEQKWDYINLDDFKSSSCWTPLAYGYLWFMLLISVSIYVVDTFTAINLLVFDRWSGQIKPVIPLSISRWIFAGCIILSFILLFYRWWRAIRVMKRGGVAQSYLDPLAVRVQSIRMGKEGRGWKRFLVFAELTKSRKGADYVALFSFYSFEAWLRIVFAEGPRQVINAITLYSVMRLNLLPVGHHAATEGHTPIVQFFVNVGLLADLNVEQAVILFGMLWTLLIWVISVLSLIVSIILYMVFLWHHIPSTDSGLGGYCRRKINGRMEKIVREKVNKALKKENELLARQQAKQGAEFKRQPTLPDVGTTAAAEPFPGISRQTTNPPDYTSRPHTSRNSGDSIVPLIGSMNGRGPPPLNRGLTNASDASWASYNSNAPLIAGAGEMGYNDRAQTPVSGTPSPWGSRPPPNRSMTGMSQPSQRSFSPAPGSRPGTSRDGRGTPVAYQMEPLARTGTGLSGLPRSVTAPLPESGTPIPQSRSLSANQHNPYFPPLPTNTSGASFAGSTVRSPDEMQGRQTPASTANRYFPPPINPNGRNSPAPSYRSQAPSGPPQSRPHFPSDGRSSPAPSYRSQAPPMGPRPMGPTPIGTPFGRSATPVREPTLPTLPTLPRLRTSGSISDDAGEHSVFNPGAESMPSASAASTNGGNRSFSRSGMTPNSSGYSARPAPQSAQSAYPPSRPINQPLPSRQDSYGDILDGY